MSIVIPCFNHAHYLPYAIQSILAQTFDDWEVIVVDDGSTDATASVTTQFADPRIRYIYQENQGLSAARNAGIHVAEGRYLAFLDADDQWEPQFLERCCAVLEADEQLGGVYTGHSFIDEAGDSFPRWVDGVVPQSRFRERLLEGGLFPVHAAMVRASVLSAVGLFDRALNSVEDWDFWLRLSECFEMKGIPEPLARYRVYPGSMSTNAGRMHASRLAVLSKYFGAPDGNVATWSKEKRHAFGFALRDAALGYIQQGQPDEGWRVLVRAISTWPQVLERLDTFYELACGDQPPGYRGQAQLLDIDDNGADMLRRLDSLFSAVGAEIMSLRRTAYGNAYLALGMLSDQAGRWSRSRHYLLQAIGANPRLLHSGRVLRRLLKVSAGKRVVARARKVLGDGLGGAGCTTPLTRPE